MRNTGKHWGNMGRTNCGNMWETQGGWHLGCLKIRAPTRWVCSGCVCKNPLVPTKTDPFRATGLTGRDARCRLLETLTRQAGEILVSTLGEQLMAGLWRGQLAPAVWKRKAFPFTNDKSGVATTETDPSTSRKGWE